MKLSLNAQELRQIIEKAIEDHMLTQAEYNQILEAAASDGHIDPQERALLAELQNMIDEKVIKLVP
jgi:uncharacterized membrane protein YebE (DUF533 family)